MHYLTHHNGFQTWEYSPVYSIRSWFYIIINSPIALMLSYFDADKRIAFFGTRSYLGLLSSIIEASFYSSVCQTFNPRVGRYLLAFLIGSAGMYISAIALLPSSFTLYTTTLGYAFAIKPPTVSKDGFKRCLFATLSFAFGAIAGWPFALTLAGPFVIEQLFMYTGGPSIFKKRLEQFIKAAAISSLLFVSCVAIANMFNLIPPDPSGSDRLTSLWKVYSSPAEYNRIQHLLREWSNVVWCRTTSFLHLELTSQLQLHVLISNGFSPLSCTI